MTEGSEDRCLEYNPKKRYTDEELEKTIFLLVDISILYILDIEARGNMLKSIKESTGASNRQLLRVLKIGRDILNKIK
ncbi:hypothetical protein [Clostridium formicaceticum]|uniref:Uncharacterized protein n=1 Tax=Clostridium formicaceticum TaxID=1497 RepID=A0AAC9RN46_9CLOT|nr:hypothetical protein [Clostridium formicaceticum]AOY78077.1 hypothetical protein BJL90_20745 [Clostridium formicaceticum]ARE88719.1 hypothetical protein CLFO_31250 [Clostridium formicaceticum]